MLIHMIPEPVFSLCFEVALVTEVEGSAVGSVHVTIQQMLVKDHKEIINVVLGVSPKLYLEEKYQI